MFRCIKPCFACTSDDFYKKRIVGSIYGDPDPLLKRDRKYKRFVVGDRQVWVDPCSRDHFKADEDGISINNEEAALLKKHLSDLGVARSELKRLSISELGETYEEHIKGRAKEEKSYKKKKVIPVIPTAPRQPKAAVPSSDEKKRTDLIAWLAENGRKVQPNTGLTKLLEYEVEMKKEIAVIAAAGEGTGEEE